MNLGAKQRAQWVWALVAGAAVRRAAASLMFGALIASPAQAHRGHETLSVVEFDAQGRVTVTHRLAVHDTEPELVALAPNAAPSLDDPQAVAALQQHLSRAFKVNGVSPRYVSHRFEGDDLVLVYQSPSQGAPAKVTIDYMLFPDSRRPGVGQVNVRFRGVTRSLRMLPDQTRQSVSF